MPRAALPRVLRRPGLLGGVLFVAMLGLAGALAYQAASAAASHRAAAEASLAHHATIAAWRFSREGRSWVGYGMTQAGELLLHETGQHAALPGPELLRRLLAEKDCDCMSAGFSRTVFRVANQPNPELVSLGEPLSAAGRQALLAAAVAAAADTAPRPNSPEFKAGAFDTTTGALRLEVELKDGGSAGARFVFEGTAISGVAMGRVSDGTQNGSFRISRTAGEAPGAQPAQNEAAAALQKGFAEVSGWVTKAADLVPAARYAYQPVKTVRTFGQLIAHLADSYNYYCARAAGRNVEWSDPAEKGATDKATILPKLKQALDGCNSAYGASGQVTPLLNNVAHTNLHYGNMITYLRMLGLAPPSS